MNKRAALPLLTLALVLLGNGATAYDRYVVVNGALVSPADLAMLDMLHGEYIPNGRYWLDFDTGEWGYEGGPAQGILGGRYYGDSAISKGCTGGFQHDCKTANFCEQNPGICSPIN